MNVQVYILIKLFEKSPVRIISDQGIIKRKKPKKQILFLISLEIYVSTFKTMTRIPYLLSKFLTILIGQQVLKTLVKTVPVSGSYFEAMM